MRTQSHKQTNRRPGSSELDRVWYFAIKGTSSCELQIVTPHNRSPETAIQACLAGDLLTSRSKLPQTESQFVVTITAATYTNTFRQDEQLAVLLTQPGRDMSTGCHENITVVFRGTMAHVSCDWLPLNFPCTCAPTATL